jgi:hypothetical protein
VTDEQPPHFEHLYTVVLFAVAGLALMTAFSSTMIMDVAAVDTDAAVVTAVLKFTRAVELVLFTFALAVGVLRTYGSRLAIPTTPAVSILLIFLFPIGTLAFIYWLGWVRKRENPAPSSPYA